MAARVGDRIRIKGCIPSMFFSDGDVALIEEVNENFVMALFDQPENKRVHGAGLWAVDHRWYELISGDEYRIAALERKVELLTQVVQLLATTALSGVQQSHAFNGLIHRIES